MSRPDGVRRLPRFSRAERAVHHATALLLLVCLATAACLYVPAIAAAVGRRDMIKTVHVLAGFGLPVPIVLGWASRAFRVDLRRLNRFAPSDWEWLRSPDRRAVSDGRGLHPVGKFNAGQKLNASFVAGAILVMLGTGLMLTFPAPWPDAWRTGATFVHDWLTFAVLTVFLGHLWFALRDPGAMGGMWHGQVERRWAARHHPAWLAEHALPEHPAPGETTPDEPMAEEPMTAGASADGQEKRDAEQS